MMAGHNNTLASDVAITRHYPHTPRTTARKEGPTSRTFLYPAQRQPFVTTGGGGALPLPTKQPVKLNEATTKANASATFFTEAPYHGCPMATQLQIGYRGY